MAAAEPGQLEFRGEDATECELFINAVSRHALSIGKQRDDQWMADFASSCFTLDALRWWDRLDDETQGSWKVLRKAMLARYRPLFHGKSGEEAEKFIHMVRERAFDEGKQIDNHWLIGFASTCFVGSALRWYASLEPRVQTNWIMLQGALLAQYPCDPQGNLPNLIPTPAAAAAAAVIPGTGVVSAPRTMRTGRIRVTKERSSARYYISKFTILGDFFRLTSTVGDAMIVAWDWPCSDLQILTVRESKGDSCSDDTVGVRRVAFGENDPWLPCRMRATSQSLLYGGSKIEPFKGWRISESASGRGIIFELTAINEEGQTLYATLNMVQNVQLLPSRPLVTLSQLKLSLEPL